MLDVPSRLLGHLVERRVDIALLPTIDYQRLDGLIVLPFGAIGCDGPTLTVRLFSKSPFEQTRVVACDPDSHTSVALSKVIFKKRFGLSPTYVDLAEASGSLDETRLLIGDKVVCEPPLGFAHQLDLGQAWKELTGLPFVFAVWVARKNIDVQGLAPRLLAAREAGLANVEQIITTYGVPRGWPIGLARQYLTSYLKYDVGSRQLDAIRLFHALSAELGVIANVKSLDIWPVDVHASLVR